MIRTAFSFVAVSGFFGFAALAQESTGMKLEAAGFKMKEARSETEMTRLKSIPAHKFVRRTRGGVAYYIYPDPVYCKCAYIGNQKAMDDYRAVNSPVTGLPNYSGTADVTKRGGDNVEQDMFTDMGEDGDMPGNDENIFDPGAALRF